MRGCAACAGVALLLALAVAYLQRSLWWASYDLDNCASCAAPSIPWADVARPSVSQEERESYVEKGFAVLKAVLLDHGALQMLGAECDRLPNTLMSDAFAKFILPVYDRYEHRLETRSALLRDWAVHGPFGRWAAELMNVSQVRFYNSELIFHRGAGCKLAWHRDSLAAPFDPEVPSAVFNIYLHDISGENDGLTYVSGSHLNPSTLPDDIRVEEPKVAFGDVLVHSANAYHTTSGRGCWRRRSLQFRYFAADEPATFAHGPQRQSGPLPWTLVHAPKIAPHALALGDALEGPWYPRVHPSPLEAEQGPLPGPPWGLLSLGSFILQSAALQNASGKPVVGFVAMDGVVKDPADWEWRALDNATAIMMPAMKKSAKLLK